MSNQKKNQRVDILLSDKIDFKIKMVKRYNYIRIKQSIHEEDMTIVNIYVPNIRAAKYIKQN